MVENLILLHAGLGTRLLPFTASRIKGMIPVFGRPLLEHHLRLAEIWGIKKTWIFHYKPFSLEQINGHFATEIRTHRVEESTWKLLWRTAARLLSSSAVILNGDLFLDDRWGSIIERHLTVGSDLTLVTSPFDTGAARKTGKCRWACHKNNDVLKTHHAQPHAGAIPLCEIGMSVIQPRMWPIVASAQCHMSDPWADEIVPAAILAGLTVRAEEADFYVRDVGTWKGLLDVHQDLMSSCNYVRSDGAKLSDDSIDNPLIRHSFITQGATVAPTARVHNSVIMKGAHISSNVRLDYCVVMPNAKVSSYSRIIDTVVTPEGAYLPIEVQ